MNDRQRWSLSEWKVPLLRRMDGERWEALPLAIRPRKKPDRGPLRYHPWVPPACGMLVLIGLMIWSMMK